MCFSTVQSQEKESSNQIKLNYHSTSFNRDGVGPWHVVGIGYSFENKKYTIIPILNLSERKSFGNNIASGVQFEIDSYLKGENQYQNLNVSFSNALLFQKFRIQYSFYKNYPSIIEAEYGTRYIKTQRANVFAIVLGATKYFGNYYFNLRSFGQIEDSDFNVALSSNVRYYLNGAKNYISVLMNYGTGPDHHYIQNAIASRLSLQSYGAGLGYFTHISKKIKLGLQFNYNRQEYAHSLFQNEYNFLTSIGFKL